MWQPKVGDVVVIPTTLDDVEMREYTVSKTDKHTIQCGSTELTFYTAFAWPVSVKEQLLTVLRERKRLKFEFDESIKLVYELKNKIARGEI